LQLYAVRELATRFPPSKTGVVITVMCPGLCGTELARSENSTFMMRFIVRGANMAIGRTAEEGSRTILHAAHVGPDGHGKYISDCRIREDQLPAWVTNEKGKKQQQRVWHDLFEALEKRRHKVDLSVL
jgi:hypothetical protein